MKKYIYISVCLVIAIVAVAFESSRSVQVTRAYGIGDNTVYQPGTNTSVLCQTGTSTRLVASSTSREYIRIGNTSAANTMYLSLGTAAASTSGIMVPAGTSFQLDNSSILFQGSVFCIGATATATITTIP